MDRAKLSGLAFALSTALLGTIALTTWQPATDAATLADSGISPTHAATCDVRFSPVCIVIAADAGIAVSRYERITFPVYFQTDGGSADAVLPPNIPVSAPGEERCVQVMRWGSCAMVPCGAAPATCALWGAAMPFATVQRPCVRQRADAGLPCPRALADGGSVDFGDLNVFPRSSAVDPAQCESVECAVFAGDNPNTDL